MSNNKSVSVLCFEDVGALFDLIDEVEESAHCFSPLLRGSGRRDTTTTIQQDSPALCFSPLFRGRGGRDRFKTFATLDPFGFQSSGSRMWGARQLVALIN